MGNCSGSRSKKKKKSSNSVVNSHPISGSTDVLSKNTHSAYPLNPKAHDKEKCKPITLPTPSNEGDIIYSPHLKAFMLSELKNATGNFHPESLIGEGGFGFVYKGWINEKTIAVKKLKPEGFQGHKEWLSEVNYLSRLHHPNVVKLIGYCLEGENCLLVYEYMPKGSLENHLFERDFEVLSWALRMKVVIGAARGLCFLHESKQQVIYRDFKASNILLNLEFNAKVSDFGLAKEGPSGDRSHVTTEVIGTQGYAAPEYLATGHLTAKCDVYSFGVVLLELLSGRRAIDKTKAREEENLVEWAKPYLRDRRKVFRIMDTKLEGQYPQKGAFMVSFLALQCIGDVKVRPSMAEVLAVLEKVPVPRKTYSRHKKSSMSPRRSNVYCPKAFDKE